MASTEQSVAIPIDLYDRLLDNKYTIHDVGSVVDPLEASLALGTPNLTYRP